MTTYTRKPFYRRGVGASASSFWRGVVVGSTAPDSGVPLDALTADDGGPIFTDTLDFILVD